MILLFFYLTETKAQQVKFEKEYNYGYAETAECVRQTKDGGYIMAGRQGISINVQNVLLIKTDSLGEVEWEKFFPAHNGFDNRLNDIIELDSGGYIGTGFTTQSGKGAEMYIMRFDEFGDTLWTKMYGTIESDRGHAIKQAYDGGFVVAGMWADNAGVLRVSESGDSLWVKAFPRELGTMAFSMEQSPDSGFVFVGAIGRMHNGRGDFFIVKVDSLGSIVWEKTFGGNGSERAHSIKRVNQVGYIVTGYTTSFGNTGEFGFDFNVLLVRLNEAGDTIWVKHYENSLEDAGAQGNHVGNSVSTSSDGGFVVMTHSYWPFYDKPNSTKLIKTDSLGNELWRKNYFLYRGGGKSIISTKDNAYAFCGNIVNENEEIMAFLIKTDSNGNALTTSVQNELENNLSVNIYPNPFSEILNIDISGEEMSSLNEIEIFDFTGKKVRHLQTTSNNIQIERAELSKGIYILKVIKENYKVLSKKIIVQ